LNPGLLPYHVFNAFTVNQHWCRHESSTRRYLVALSLEVPCQGSKCRCQTYPTCAPTVAYHRRHPISTV
jgi:hypothetical protein